MEKVVWMREISSQYYYPKKHPFPFNGDDEKKVGMVLDYLVRDSRITYNI